MGILVFFFRSLSLNLLCLGLGSLRSLSVRGRGLSLGLARRLLSLSYFFTKPGRVDGRSQELVRFLCRLGLKGLSLRQARSFSLGPQRAISQGLSIFKYKKFARLVSKSLSRTGVVDLCLFALFSDSLTQRASALGVLSRARLRVRRSALLCLAVCGLPSLSYRTPSSSQFVSSLFQVDPRTVGLESALSSLVIPGRPESSNQELSPRVGQPTTVHTMATLPKPPVPRESGTRGYSYFTGWSLLGHSSIFFLRVNSLYNKSRYSRNRQTYRTGVYWCMWLTVLSVIGLYYYLYVFLIKFTYVWSFFYASIACFFLYYFKSRSERHWLLLNTVLGE